MTKRSRREREWYVFFMSVEGSKTRVLRHTLERSNDESFSIPRAKCKISNPVTGEKHTIDGDLFSVLKNTECYKRMKRRGRVGLALKVIALVRWLHDHRVIFFDLKPENLVIVTDPSNANDFSVKLIDLEASRLYAKETGLPVHDSEYLLAPTDDAFDDDGNVVARRISCTLRYIPPEVLGSPRKKEAIYCLSFEEEVWMETYALAVTLYNIFFRCQPRSNSTDGDVRHALDKTDFDIWLVLRDFLYPVQDASCDSLVTKRPAISTLADRLGALI